MRNLFFKKAESLNQFIHNPLLQTFLLHINIFQVKSSN